MESNQIAIQKGHFIDKYSQKKRHIKIHKKRHKVPDNLYFDSRRDLYIIDESDKLDEDYIHYYWGRYRKPIAFVDFHHENDNKESYLNSLIIDFSIMQSIKSHFITNKYLVWFALSDRMFDSFFVLNIIDRQNLKPIYSFYKKSYLPFLINFASGSIAPECTTYESRNFDWSSYSINNNNKINMQLIKRESFVEICYDDKMVPIDDINIEDIGGWRIKINLDFNKTILAINVTRSHESLISLLPLENSERNPSYDHKECGIKASIKAFININHDNDDNRDDETDNNNNNNLKNIEHIEDHNALACFEWNKAIDFVKKKHGGNQQGHEQCISASVQAQVEHTEKQSSDENDNNLFIVTESETIGLFVCDGHLHNDTALLNAVWIEEHLHPLPKVEITKLNDKINTYLIQDENLTVNLEFHGEINHIISSSDSKTNSRTSKKQYDNSYYGFINGTINVYDHHHMKKIYFKNHLSIFDRMYDRVSWWL